jgi:hypothetical protein
VDGTAASADVVNNTIADLAAMIEDCYSITGKNAVITNPWQIPVGTVSEPGLAFQGDLNAGIYRSAADELAITAGGGQRIRADSAGAHVTGTLDVSGAVTAAAGLTVTTVGLTVSAGSVSLPTGSLPRASFGALGQQVSSSTSTFSTTSLSMTDITNATVTITSTGRPVLLFLQNDGTASESRLYVGVNGVATPTSVSASIRLVKSGSKSLTTDTVISANGSASASLGIETPPGVIHYLDTDVADADTYTYKLQVLCATNTIFACEYCKLVAYEL